MNDAHDNTADDAEMLRRFGPRPARQRAHPADVTAERIDYAVRKYFYFLDEIEKDAAWKVAEALREVAAGDRIGRKRRD